MHLLIVGLTVLSLVTTPDDTLAEITDASCFLEEAAVAEVSVVPARARVQSVRALPVADHLQIASIETGIFRPPR